MEHIASEHCPCYPTLTPVPREDGSIGWHYAHHEPDQTPAQQAERAAAIAEGIDEVRRQTP